MIELLKIGPHVTACPIVHGSGDFSLAVRNIMSSHSFDCLAVPLPQSFQEQTEQAILQLPTASLIVQKDWEGAEAAWDRDSDSNSELKTASYVPVDPCQPVVAAIRSAMGDRIPRQFIDLEVSSYQPNTAALPDPFALKKVPVGDFAATVLPSLRATENEQWAKRIRHMAHQLKQLSIEYKNVLFVVSLLDWPWIREQFHQQKIDLPENSTVHDCQTYRIDSDTLYFAFGEIPFVTELYEKARNELEDESKLSVDGIKELLIAARTRYRSEFGNRARKVPPRTLRICMKYIRNLTLIENRISPELITVVTASKQVVGDGFALSVLELAKSYGFGDARLQLPVARMGIGEATLGENEIFRMACRLPGPPLVWHRLELIPKPDDREKSEWTQQWNPYSHCSWPPEDALIENFRQTVFDRALESMGADLVKTEKFTSSVKDGIDVRDTVRHWYEDEIYVKVLPPNRGQLDCAVMLFDSPADPREYPWRTTWFAEHRNESTLSFYATNFLDEPVGPGICLATYGGAMFLFPPIAIPDIWTDSRLDFCTTLEERLLAAACLHSSCPQVALLSSSPPTRSWNQIAKGYKKNFVHLPLAKFSDSTIQQLRMVHVLNGKEIRSFAADYIRRV